MRDGQHDFDFEIGTWKTHVTRLQHPLTGSTSWVEYEGTTVVSTNILVRNVWSDITPNSCRFEQSFSADGGRTWEVNWTAIDTRITRSADAETVSASQSSSGGSNRQHDFDFAIGTWKAHLLRLVHPLTGSTTWVTYDGTSVVRKVWNGRANLEEFEADGAAGHIEGLTLRLYDPQARRWNQLWATSNDGTLGQPMIGDFRNGHGEFYDQEPLNGRALFMRWVQSFIAPMHATLNNRSRTMDARLGN